MSVHFSSGTNSTLFTNCCDTAITDDEKNCPNCKEEIIEGTKTRWDIAMNAFYGRDKVKEMRIKASIKTSKLKITLDTDSNKNKSRGEK